MDQDTTIEMVGTTGYHDADNGIFDYLFSVNKGGETSYQVVNINIPDEKFTLRVFESDESGNQLLDRKIQLRIDISLVALVHNAVLHVLGMEQRINPVTDFFDARDSE